MSQTQQALFCGQEDMMQTSAYSILSTIAQKTLTGKEADVWSAFLKGGEESVHFECSSDTAIVCRMLDTMGYALADLDLVASSVSLQAGPGVHAHPASVKALAAVCVEQLDAMAIPLRLRMGIPADSVPAEMRHSLRSLAFSLLAANMDIRDDMPVGCEDAAFKGMMADLIDVTADEFDGNDEAAVGALSQALREAWEERTAARKIGAV